MRTLEMVDWQPRAEELVFSTTTFTVVNFVEFAQAKFNTSMDWEEVEDDVEEENLEGSTRTVRLPENRTQPATVID